MATLVQPHIDPVAKWVGKLINRSILDYNLNGAMNSTMNITCTFRVERDELKKLKEILEDVK